MSIYNRKSWICGDTKHWIHNGKHYRKRLGFFGTKRKFSKKSIKRIKYYCDKFLKSHYFLKSIIKLIQNKKLRFISSIIS